MEQIIQLLHLAQPNKTHIIKPKEEALQSQDQSNISEGLKCQQCGKHFAKIGKLNRHIQETHDNIKSFICEVCQKQFKRSYHLKRHQLIHSGEKPFSCTVINCPMKFSCKHHLDRHMNLIHLEKKIFNCDNCDFTCKKKKQFLQIEYLIRQLKQHKKEIHGNNNEKFKDKPNDRSSIDFKEEYDLDNSMEKSNEINEYESNDNEGKTQETKQKKEEHNYYFVCKKNNCNKSFTRVIINNNIIQKLRNLKKHVQVHHENIKNFLCEQCNTKFAHKCTLQKHIQKQHEK